MHYYVILEQIQINNFFLDLCALWTMICCNIFCFCDLHDKSLMTVISLIKYEKKGKPETNMILF